MLQYGHVTTLVATKAQYSKNIKDLLIVDTASGPVLVAISNIGAMISYGLAGADGAAQLVTWLDPPKYGLYLADPRLHLVETGSGKLLVPTGLQGSVQSAARLSETGRLGSHVPLFGAAQVGPDVVAMHGFEIGAQDYMLASRNGSLSLSLYQLGGDGLPVALGQSAAPRVQTAGGEYDGIEVISVAGATYAYAVSARGNVLAVFSVTSSGVVLTGQIGGDNTIGIDAPRDLAVVATAGRQFLIVAGGESDSLSVLHINDGGRLMLADHVVDSATTRFQAVTALATAELGGRAFIFVGGGDDGITVMTLDGQGRLILLATIEDTAAMSLADVSAIEARVVGGKIALFVTSATEAGITQLSFDPGIIGVSSVSTGSMAGTTRDDILVGTGGSSMLAGGAGDDILIAREGVVRLSGGTGADIFIPGYGAQMVTIQDFDPRADRLDLSEMAYIRSLAQLRIVPTSTGALLVAGPLKIEILTVSGTMLAPSFFTEEMFRLAHYANAIDYIDLVEPVVPDPGMPATPPITGGATGGYVPPVAMPRVTLKAVVQIGTAQGDRLVVKSVGATLNGRDGNDQLIGGRDQDLLYGQNGNDTILGGSGSDLIGGGPGNDSLLGELGHDLIHGGPGLNIMRGGPGDDRMWGHNLADTIDGDDGNDIIFGYAGNDLLRGGAGSDLIYAMDGADTVLGGAGHDRLTGKGNGTYINGGDGNDMIVVTADGNVVIAETGNDTVTGGFGADLIMLGLQDDVAFARAGNDRVYGDAGNDTMRGDDGDDQLFGGPGDDRLFGGRGNDRLSGADGQDLLLGDAGNDRLDAGAGRDSLNGGVGDDLMIGGGDQDILIGGDGNDSLGGDAGRDTLLGGAGNDRLYGGADNDTLDGADGSDLLDGGDGIDALNGGAGNDSLYGGAGNDTLVGGEGQDRLSGGAGVDVFVFAPSGPEPVGVADQITDFVSGEDVIDLTAFPDTLIWIGSEAFTTSGAVEVRMDVLSGRVRLQIDMNGDRQSDLSIDILGATISPFDLLF